MEKYNNRRKNFDTNRRPRFDQKNPERYDAVCSSCGKECQVPFKPIKGKPVLCVNCYKISDSKEMLRSNENHKAICDECGKECEVPFKPNGRKPVLCSRCYENDKEEFDFDDIPKKDNDQIENKLNMINSKLDEIMKMLNIVSSVDKGFEEKVKKSKKKLRQAKNLKSIKKSKKSSDKKRKTPKDD
ncbi:MAG: hypothetical protein PHW52_05510 [Candidatus Pacebacteria bacterium]|nr:hypothetical protein [Candidatus Paceibacterota bacterium]